VLSNKQFSNFATVREYQMPLSLYAAVVQKMANNFGQLLLGAPCIFGNACRM